MIDGTGDPRSNLAFQLAIKSLFNISYVLMFAIKKATAIDYPLDLKSFCATAMLCGTEDMMKV
jgi:hypothetical protein